VIRGVAFDLDDTLYPERDYVRTGFEHVARFVGQTPGEIQAVTAWLVSAFDGGRRGDTFDGLLEAFPQLDAGLTVRQLVDAYRQHVPDIALDAEVADALDRLRRRGLRLGVVSDGPVASQSAKVAALGLSRWFDPIVLTDALGPGFAKPSPGGFAHVARLWRLPGSQLAYVADNPTKDFAGPRGLGWRTIRVRTQGQLHAALEPATPADRPDLEVRSIAEVAEVVDAPA
jgi:putative hydrolase of the HAD superfamily